MGKEPSACEIGRSAPGNGGSMRSENRVRKRKTYVWKALILVLLYACALITVLQNIQTAYAAQETYITLLETKVGRYRLNYTGNTNHYTTWTPDGIPMNPVVYNDTNGPYANSSTAVLSPSEGAERIRYAFLVWETRAPQAATEAIGFIAPNGQSYSLRASHTVNDFRVVGNNPGITSMFCMAADVTSIVSKSGYGAYSVYNLPRWVYGQGGDRTGGESPGSWQLIVVEEGDALPVRAVTLDMGAKFYLGKDFGTRLTLGSGLKSKSSGAAGGQVFFGASNASASAAMHETVASYDSSGALIGQAHSNTTYGPGLYKNGTLVNNRDYGNGCIRMSLSDVGNIGNQANQISMTVENDAWTTSFLLGMSVDLACPDFLGEQKTTVKDAKSVTVTGSFTNTAQTPSTGIYDGTMVVTLADGLSAVSATAFVDETRTVNGRISGNTVIFEGNGISSVMNNGNVRYTVECTVNREGITRFDNSAAFHGYLCADGVRTGYWIDRMWTSASYGIPKYVVTADCGTGIETVSGAGEYTYGSTVRLQAVLKPGYHWKGWTGGYSSALPDVRFPMPAGHLSVTAEGEANTYTIVFDANDGREKMPVPDIVTQYEKEETLPDGAEYYHRYTMDGEDVTTEAAAGTIPVRATPASHSGESGVSGEGSEEPAGEGEPEPGEPAGEGEDGSEESAGEGEPEPGEPAGEGENGSEESAGEGENGSEESAGEGENEVEGPAAESENGRAYDGEATENAAAQDMEDVRAAVQKTAYPSVFLGWATEDGRNGYSPRWKAGDTVVNLTEEDHGVVTLYAIWDDCPWIQAEELYYTLKQAQSGFITEAEILSHAAASDREDGSPIAPGFHENGTAFFIPDYSAEDFTQFLHDGSCTENLTVTDSTGSTYQKQIVIHIVDTAASAVLPEGTTRFIDETYYRMPAKDGGLEDHSIWKTDPAYRSTLIRAFQNRNNDTPVYTFEFSAETLREMKEYAEGLDAGNRREPEALRTFCERFLTPALK